jgi:glutathione synthase/RimK-type ligase-like ATP-grasp enzyme
MKIALLSCTTWAGIFEKEQAFAKEINLPDTQIEVEAWTDETVDWTQYDYLIFRSVWDYFVNPEAFDLWLTQIENLGIKTLNSIMTVRHNQHKFYLHHLQNKGVEIVPSVFIAKNTGLDLSVLHEKNWAQAVIKPAVSGGAYLTKLFNIEDIDAVTAEYAPIAVERDLLLQPFLSEIQTQGEISLLFFNGVFSHAVIKTAAEGEYRIQSQFGGTYSPYSPDNQLLTTAENIITAFGGDLLYARVDGVFHKEKFLLMELELIEPDLYFETNEAAKNNFISALAHRLAR